MSALLTPSPFVPPWAPPAEVDEFRIRSHLGKGGMGHVYLAHDVSLDRPVALKFIADSNPDPLAKARLYLEARALARLQHPNVVAIYRVGEVDSRPYLAYEFIIGAPLDRVARPMPWEQVLEIAIGLARGLAAVHARGMLHRDIKPANVILADGGQPKLIDFGLATVSIEGAPPQSPPAERQPPLDIALLQTQPQTPPAPELLDTQSIGLTQGGELMGTPLYLAPERWRGRPAAASADLYALGLLLYELLTGEHPRQGFTREQLTGQSIMPLGERLPDVPAPLAHLIDCCLRVDPAERMASALSLLDALESLAGVLRVLRVHREDLTREPSPDEQDIRLVSESFARVSRQVDEFGQRFYAEVFARDPSLRLLFPTDLTEQRRKLASALHLAVESLRHPERLTSLLGELGARHAAYGVEPSHFATVGAALLAAIGAVDRAATTPEVERAWLHAYGAMARAMRTGLLQMRQSVPPLPRYARLGHASIAYARLGEGSLDMVLVPGWLSHLEVCWQNAELGTWLRQLAALGRLVLYDRRGSGLSEALEARGTVFERVAELRAVLDAAGVQRAVLIAEGLGSAVAAHFAATYPERVRALIAIGAVRASAGGAAGMLRGLDAAARRQLVVDAWGSPVLLDELAPSMARDSTFRRFWASYLRMAAPPLTALALLEEALATEPPAGAQLAGLPVLALHRRRDRLASLAGARELIAGIPGACLRELEGEDHLPYVGDTEEILEHIRDFAGVQS